MIEQELVQPDARFETLYGGRTNRVWRVEGPRHDAVLKLYCRDLRNPLFRNDAGLEVICLRTLQTTGFVPNLRASGTCLGDSWVFYDHAPGEPWQIGAEKVGQLLSGLHSKTITAELPAGCNGSDDIAIHTESILQECRSDRHQELLRLRPSPPVPATPETCLVHGDPVPGNILVAPTGLTLIDWQCPAIGDPCEDLALFLSPAMQRLYRGEPLSQAEETAFLQGYAKGDIVARYHMLRPWYAWRMAAYCLWRAENGAPDYLAGLELELAAL